MTGIEQMGARALIAKMKNREIRCEQVVRAYLARIARYGGKDQLNAVCELSEVRAISEACAYDARADGRALPLFGLPILVKDNIDVMGMHTMAGSRALDDNIATRDADVTHNLRTAGAIILGKTNMTEFANYTSTNMPGGYSSRAGRVKHAYNRDINPSGSSTGSAVAVSAGLCAAAIGTDTSFSVVACATVNGVVGFKPAMGALSQRGIVPIAHTLDSAGVLAKDMGDAALVCACMRDAGVKNAPPDAPNPERLSVAVNMFHKDEVSKAQWALYERVFGAWSRAGVSLSEVSHPYTPMQRAIMKYEFKHDLEAYLRDSAARRKTLREIVEYYEANPETMLAYGDVYLRAALDEASGNLDDDEYIQAMNERAQAREALLTSLGAYDACVMTGPTNIMHFTGMPSLSLTLGLGNDGAPRGIILYGADEDKLIRAALALEPMTGKTPPPALD